MIYNLDTIKKGIYKMKINQSEVVIDMTSEERKTLACFFDYLYDERDYSSSEICSAFLDLLAGNTYDNIKINIIDG